MASRAIVINYNIASVDPSGDVLLEIKSVFADTVDNTKTAVLTSTAMLDVSLPASWPAAIRNAMVDTGVHGVYNDLTTAGCFIPTYS